ncbi:hypothetical protein VEE10_18460 [Escherichia coli]|nr:hypothetical protein VEE10_18460 [Escherichia coli]
MRDDFCAFILTHGRPDKVLTYRKLRRAGYTGKIFIVVDDEDKTRNQYMAEFGEQVLVFGASGGIQYSQFGRCETSAKGCCNWLSREWREKRRRCSYFH